MSDCEGLREALAALLPRDPFIVLVGDYGYQCPWCYADEPRGGDSPEHGGKCPWVKARAALATAVAASEGVGPVTGPVMPGTNIEAYGAVAIECEHGYDVCPMCDAAPSPATEAERHGGEDRE